LALKRFKSRLNSDAISRRGSGPPGYAMSSAWMGGPRYSDAFQRQRSPNPIQLVEAYKSLIFACVELVATNTVRVPLRLYSASGGGKARARSMANPRPISRRMYRRFRELPWVARSMGVSTLEDVEEITSHPILDALDNPTGTDLDDQDYFDRETFLGTLIRYVDIIGVAYVKPEGPRGRPPELLWPLQSQYVWPERLVNSARIERYRYFLETYPKADLLRIRLRNSLVDPYGAGYAAAQAAWQYARLEDSFTSIQEQVLSIGARPALMLSPKDPAMPIGHEEARRLQSDLNSMKAGPNAGRSIVTDGSFDITPISYPPADVGQTEISRYDFERVCNCFGVPPTIFTTESNLANQQASDKALAKNAVEPRCKMLASMLTRLVRRSDERLFFAFDPAVAEDEDAEAERFNKGIACGRFTINETLKETEFEDKEWGDAPWIAGSLQQPDMITEAHEQGLETQKATVENQRKATDFQYSDDPDVIGEEEEESDVGRGITDLCESVLSLIDGEMRAGMPRMPKAAKGKGTAHVASGEHGGEFTSGSGGGAAGKKPREGKAARKPGDKPVKDKAHPVRGGMAEARREGVGKDARIVMADDGIPPAHVTAKMIAPSWTHVKVSTDPKAELLVTARDAKGRAKQVTTKEYDARSAVVKFGRVDEMIREHAKIGQEIQGARAGPHKEEADAAFLMHIQATRPGSNTDTKAKVKAYGATTLEARHIVRAPDGVRLQFIGKEGIPHDHLVHDPELAKMLVDRKNAAPGANSLVFNTTAEKVRDYTATLDGGKFTPKDFRTSRATIMAAEAVEADPRPSKDIKEHKARIKEDAVKVSRLLGNKPDEARKSYIHPTVFARWSPA